MYRCGTKGCENYGNLIYGGDHCGFCMTQGRTPIVIDATADSAITHDCGAVVTVNFKVDGDPTKCHKCGELI